MEFDDDREDEAIRKANQWFNNMHKNYERANIRYDDWLKIFDRAITNCKTPIIDLGCGSGNDTLYLLERGKSIIPCDLSKNAIENIKRNFPEIKRTECFDMSKGLPFESDFTDIVISDLSLHYFTRQTTFEILDEIKRVLKPNGLLFFRVNSIKATNYGSGQGKEIEPHLYEMKNGRLKRFFNEKDLNEFFSEWEIIYLHEEIMNRYEVPKLVWKGAVKVNK